MYTVSYSLPLGGMFTHTHNPGPFVCGSPFQILFVELNVYSIWTQHNRGRTTTFEKSSAGLASVMASFDFASEVVTEGHLDKLLWLWLVPLWFTKMYEAATSTAS